MSSSEVLVERLPLRRLALVERLPLRRLALHSLAIANVSEVICNPKFIAGCQGLAPLMTNLLTSQRLLAAL
jgi:hypothetical protein